MDLRTELLTALAQDLVKLSPDRTVLVAIDGYDGAGKTTFADNLGSLIDPIRPVIRASVDRFHNPKAVRYRQGRRSPEGFFEDSYNYDSFKRHLLNPLKQGGVQRYRPAFFDLSADNLAPAMELQSPPGAIVLIDGIFLHRQELLEYWDFSIFLRTDFAISVGRCAARDGSSSNPDDASNQRYVEGQRLYVQRCDPENKATIVIDYNDLSNPKIVPAKLASPLLHTEHNERGTNLPRVD